MTPGLKQSLLKIKEFAISLGSDSASPRWYVFGSVVDQLWKPADIDILVVYTTPHDAETVRKGINNLVIWHDIDLMLMTDSEEKALNCIAEFNAVPLFDFVSNIK